jgi:hypothetical protein
MDEDIEKMLIQFEKKLLNLVLDKPEFKEMIDSYSCIAWKGFYVKIGFLNACAFRIDTTYDYKDRYKVEIQYGYKSLWDGWKKDWVRISEINDGHSKDALKTICNYGDKILENFEDGFYKYYNNVYLGKIREAERERKDKERKINTCKSNLKKFIK